MYDSPTLQTTLFPEEDLVELFFAEADRVGLRLYLGMHDSHEHWLKNDWESEIEINVRLIDEMLERYGTHRSFRGWYMSHEGGIEYHMPKIWKPLATKLRAHDESKRILVSPRYAGEKWQPEKPLSPQQHAQHFDYIFTEMEGLIDEAAFMDGHTAFSSLEGFVAATADVCAKHGVEFWSNLETFDRDMPWRISPDRMEQDALQAGACSALRGEDRHLRGTTFPQPVLDVPLGTESLRALPRLPGEERRWSVSTKTRRGTDSVHVSSAVSRPGTRRCE